MLRGGINTVNIFVDREMLDNRRGRGRRERNAENI